MLSQVADAAHTQLSHAGCVQAKAPPGGTALYVYTADVTAQQAAHSPDFGSAKHIRSLHHSMEGCTQPCHWHSKRQ